MKKLKIKSVEVPKFREFISKVNAANPSLYMNLDSSNVYSKVSDEGRKIFKMVNMDLETVFQMEKPPSKPVKISFHDADKILTAMKYLNDDNMAGEIYYTDEGEDEGLMGSQFHLFDKKMRFKFICLDPSLGFNELDEDTKKLVVDDSYKSYSFELLSSDISSIKNANNMEREVEEMSFWADGSGVHASTNLYDMLLDEEVGADDAETYYLEKMNFNAVDSDENYSVSVCPKKADTKPGKVVFDSHDSNTIVVVALAKSPGESG